MHLTCGEPQEGNHVINDETTGSYLLMINIKKKSFSHKINQKMKTIVLNRMCSTELLVAIKNLVTKLLFPLFYEKGDVGSKNNIKQ